METFEGVIKVFIASTTRSADIPPRNVVHCGIIWSSWSKSEGCSIFCAAQMDWETSQGLGHRGMLLQCFLNCHSLGPVAMRWFDSLKASSIDSFKELTRAFGSRFVTCRRVPQPLASLLSLSMREGETL